MEARLEHTPPCNMLSTDVLTTLGLQACWNECKRSFGSRFVFILDMMIRYLRKAYHNDTRDEQVNSKESAISRK